EDREVHPGKQVEQMRRIPFVVLMLLAGLVTGPPAAVADDDRGLGSHQTVGENKDHSSFTATISTNERRVRVEVSGRQQLPGRDGPPADSRDAADGMPNTVAARSGSAAQAPNANVAAAGRRWYDPARGY